MQATTHPSRGAAGFLGAVLAGGLSATAFIVALNNHESLLLGLVYVTAVPFFVAALSAGLTAGIVAVLTGLFGVLLYAPQPLVLLYALFLALPSLLVAGLALRAKTGGDGKIYWYPEGYILTAICLYPSILFLGAAAQDGSWGQSILDRSKEMILKLLEKSAAELPPEVTANIGTLAETWAAIAPAAMGSSLIVFILVSAVVGHIVAKQQGWNLRPQFGWDGVVLPQPLLLGVAATGLATFVAPAPFDYLASNICFMLCVPLFFVGLAVTHAYAATLKKGRIVFLIVFYVILSIIVWLAVLVALIGALDQGLHLRQRLSNLPSTTNR